jgi:uncharacterized protein (DUF1330 family)
MPFEIAIGLFVTDQEQYAQYRKEIVPLLEAVGGEFRYDFEVARTLKKEVNHDINRVFMLQFRDQAAKERFFSDPVYREIRHRFFPKAVAGISTIAEYAR